MFLSHLWMFPGGLDALEIGFEIQSTRPSDPNPPARAPVRPSNLGRYQRPSARTLILFLQIWNKPWGVGIGTWVSELAWPAFDATATESFQMCLKHVLASNGLNFSVLLHPLNFVGFQTIPRLTVQVFRIFVHLQGPQCYTLHGVWVPTVWVCSSGGGLLGYFVEVDSTRFNRSGVESEMALRIVSRYTVYGRKKENPR